MHIKTKNTKIKSGKKSETEDVDLILKRIGGGSIINHKPLFSDDGEILYIIWKQIIRAYSTQTGDFVKELEPADSKIINISLSPGNPDTIIGCTDNAFLIHWNTQNGLITIKTKLCVYHKKEKKFKTFHLCCYKTAKGENVCNALITSIETINEKQDLCIELFNTRSGKRTLSKKIENFKEHYHLDVIGNQGENLIAAAQDSFLYIFKPMNGLEFIRHKIGRDVTCIVGHPQEESLATGDTSGRILVWNNITTHQPVRSSYHWHTLPVTDIVFSKYGGHLYSGGGECVLVKWLLSNPEAKSFLPRLPAPIKHLTISSRNIYVAVSTLDNGIIIVNSQKKITAMIQNFIWGAASSPKNLFPAGITIDPRTNSLVLNSQTGHIQFYNTQTKNLLYNISITAQNFLTQERTGIIVNTEVTRVAINDDGTWMATMEERDDHISHIEVRLKFWKFDSEKQSFTLNTSVELPHDIGVNALKFKPKSSVGDKNQFVVTVGKDNKFKTWKFEDSTSKHWECYSVADYLNLSAFDAGFSTDGSLLGVGFGSSLTLWVPETMEMKKCLSSKLYVQPLIRVEFGKRELCLLVVTASTEHLAIWDILSLTMKWSVPVNLSILVADPLSTFMAAFTSDNHLFVFSPDNPNPVYTKKDVLEKDVKAIDACFVPNIQNNNKNTASWQRKSQFFFLDSEQELLTLESNSESSIVLEHLSSNQNLPLSVFHRMSAVEKISAVEKPSSFSEANKSVNKGYVEEFLNLPAHAMPPMKLLCKSFILSLMGNNSEKESIKEPTRTSNTTKIQDSDDEDETTVITNDKKENPEQDRSTAMDVRNKKQSTKDPLNLDWSFLAGTLESKPPEFISW